MLTPAYKLTIGSKSVDSVRQADGSTLVELAVMLDMDTPADSFTLVLGQVGSLKPARNNAATIELGYADGGSLVQVMAGSVEDVEPNLTTRRVVGYGAARSLLRSFLDQTYETRTAGTIVHDLAGRAKVTVSRAEDGIEFPYYVIDSRRSYCQHMRDLADLCGFDLYFNSEDKIVFEKFVKGKTVHKFQYAHTILRVEVLETPAYAGMVEAWGESPTGSKGPNSSAWLTTNFKSSMGKSGSGAPKLLLERPALRTKTAAGTAAAASETRIRRRMVRGRLVTVGNPAIKLGDAIELKSLEDTNLNKTYQVRAVTHRITKREGFTTEVGFCAI